MVWHTWARDLQFPPQLHAIVTGGGLSLGGLRWVHARPDFLYPVKVMGALFRGKSLAELAAAYARGELREKRLQRWDKRGLSAAAFAAREGLEGKRLIGWRWNRDVRAM